MKEKPWEKELRLAEKHVKEAIVLAEHDPQVWHSVLDEIGMLLWRFNDYKDEIKHVVELEAKREHETT